MLEVYKKTMYFYILNVETRIILRISDAALALNRHEFVFSIWSTNKIVIIKVSILLLSMNIKEMVTYLDNEGAVQYSLVRLISGAKGTNIRAHNYEGMCRSWQNRAHT